MSADRFLHHAAAMFDGRSVVSILPFLLHLAALLVAELWCHRRRELPRWERLGHRLDTLTFAACLTWLLASSPDDAVSLPVYGGLATFSTLFVSKDAWLHANVAGALEDGLHSALFVLRPIALAACAAAWFDGNTALLVGALAATLAFLAYQLVRRAGHAGHAGHAGQGAAACTRTRSGDGSWSRT